MTRQDVTLNVTKWGVILGALVALIIVVSALRSYGDERYASRADLETVRAMAKDILCSPRVEPNHWRCKSP